MEDADRCPASLYDACGTLFGSDVAVTPDFLRYLQRSGVRAAFRRRAFDVHPDRAAVLQVPAGQMGDGFLHLRTAYERLMHFVEHPHLYDFTCIAPADAWRQKNDAVERRADGAPRRPPPRRRIRPDLSRLPGRTLLTGQFLYHAGIVPWTDLIDAVVWQRSQRPTVGQIARQWAWCTAQEIQIVLSRRLRAERFGDTAIRHGLLSPRQIQILLTRQRMIQPRIGEFFLRQGLFPARELDRWLTALHRHNRRYRGV